MNAEEPFPGRAAVSVIAPDVRRALADKVSVHIRPERYVSGKAKHCRRGHPVQFESLSKQGRVFPGPAIVVDPFAGGELEITEA